LFGILSGILPGILFDILSGMSSGPGVAHSIGVRVHACPAAELAEEINKDAEEENKAKKEKELNLCENLETLRRGKVMNKGRFQGCLFAVS
jgi:hypothetical protein